MSDCTFSGREIKVILTTGQYTPTYTVCHSIQVWNFIQVSHVWRHCSPRPTVQKCHQVFCPPEAATQVSCVLRSGWQLGRVWMLPWEAYWKPTQLWGHRRGHAHLFHSKNQPRLFLPHAIALWSAAKQGDPIKSPLPLHCSSTETFRLFFLAFLLPCSPHPTKTTDLLPLLCSNSQGYRDKYWKSNISPNQGDGEMMNYFQLISPFWADSA